MARRQDNRSSGSRAVFVAVLALCLIAGAADAKKPKKIKLETQISVSAGLNPDVDGRPSPLLVSIFQLAAVDQFQNADYFALFDPQGSALGADLLGRDRMTLMPGVDQSLSLEFDPETSFIGVVGAFRDVEKARWRAVVEIPEKSIWKKIAFFRKERLFVTADDLAISITIGRGKRNKNKDKD